MSTNGHIFTLQKPKSPKLDQIEKGFNDLMVLAKELGEIRNELNRYSSLTIDSETNKRFRDKLREFEAKMAKWRSVANDLYGKPDNIKFEKATAGEISTSVIHFMNAIFMMMNEVNYVYTTEKEEYWKVISRVKDRKAITLGALSMAVAILSIALQL
ncbi:hypothetical protein [Fodinibius sp. Rm-B-1B1-1]|uniref:hypothetical protein n=1 Tax=Fodinibius alkaliphilus TaxID=3140241 RepID=UPI00315B0264